MKKTIFKTVQEKRAYVAPMTDIFNISVGNTLLAGSSFDPTNEITYGGPGEDDEYGD